MSYQAIARKFRPKNFTELVGQSHVSQTLINALSSGRLHHALLFTGPRGTGKTSTARILASAIRCPGDPMGVGEEAQAIAQGRALDVVEIDGASNNGVDAVRELRETIGYMPSSGHYKIYIIDEVHMLSQGAFNALLKTLEEPPSHVIFILATTEAHKIPATILSRVQRYDFRKIPLRQVVDHLKKICGSESVSVSEDALWLIAKEGEGSMRDAQSFLDLVITYTNGTITAESTAEILGLSDRLLIKDVLIHLLERNLAGVLANLRALRTVGADPRRFVQDLLEMIRHLLIIKTDAQSALEWIELPALEQQEWATRLKDTAPEDLHWLFDMTLEGAQDLLKAPDTQIAFEMLVLRIADSPKFERLEEMIRVSSAPAPRSVEHDLPIQKKATDSENSTNKWLELVGRVKVVTPVMAAQLENLSLLSLQNGSVQLGLTEKLKFMAEKVQNIEFTRKLSNYLTTFWQGDWKVEVKLIPIGNGSSSAKEMQEKKEQQEWEKLRKQVEGHPVMQSVQSHFKSEIKSIKTLTPKQERS